MNAVAVIYVNDHLEELRAQTQRKRHTASLAPKRSLQSRLAAAAAGLGRRPRADETRPTLPALSDQPFRV